MSEGGFLKRWSRRKRSEVVAPERAPAEGLPIAAPEEPGQAVVPPAKQDPAAVSGAPAAKPEDEPVDPATLPPIESLGADSDYRVFLRKGVPEALRAAALRRAWMTDPAIRDFPSPAVDYAWDFNTPEFALRPTDDVEKMLDQIFPPKAAEGAEAAPGAVREEAAAAEREPASISHLPQKEAAAGNAPVVTEAETPSTEVAAPRRKHGGALPE